MKQSDLPRGSCLIPVTSPGRSTQVNVGNNNILQLPSLCVSLFLSLSLSAFS
jgi:hypothetical protein